MFWFALFFMWLVLPYTSSGPLWQYTFDSLNCSESWWKMALYVGQLSGSGLCLPNSWYLSADMQVFFVSLFIIWVVFKRPKLGYVLLFLLVAISVAYRVSAVAFPLGINIWAWFPFWPFRALVPYVFGIGLGYIFINVENNEKKNRKVSLGIYSRWTVLGVVAFMMVFTTLAIWAITLYSGSRLMFYFAQSLGGVIVMACLATLIFVFRAGYGGSLRSFFCASVFHPLAKLSFGSYLYHYIILTYLVAAQQHLFWYSSITVLSWTVFTWFSSYFVSFFVHWLIERPCIFLEDKLSKRLFFQ